MFRTRSTLPARAFFAIALAVATSAAVAAEPAKPIDEATQKRIDSKTKRLIEAAKIDDAAKAERVKAILGDWLVVMWDWHKANDEQLNGLWKQWSAARTFKPGEMKDEYPGEVVATQIDALYASLKPAYQDFVAKLGAELSPEQVDAIKETWSRSPGMTRTYNAYLEIAPDLTDEQKQVIKDRMLIAREAAMLTDADKEVVNLFKRHKLKVEQYVGALEWQKLHKRFAAGGSKPAATKPAE